MFTMDWTSRISSSTLDNTTTTCETSHPSKNFKSIRRQLFRIILLTIDKHIFAKAKHNILGLGGCKKLWEAATICLRPLQVDNIFVFIRQLAPISACWLFKTSATSLYLWPFDLESGVWVTCDVGYLCANSSLYRPFCSRVTPDVRDRRHTDVRQTDR